MNVRTIVEDIQQDLPSVKWSRTVTEMGGKPFSIQGAEAFGGTGIRWTHNLIIWTESGEDRCDGAVVSLMEAKGLIVRYTPDLAKQALKMIKDGGLRGGAKEEA